MKHVFLGSLPIGTEFLHKSWAYKKIDENTCKDFDGQVWSFEPHCGAVITLTQFEELGLTIKDERIDNKNFRMKLIIKE